MNTKVKGNIAESFVIAKCMAHGWTVLEPRGENDPYDIVIDKHDGKGFQKVQVKSSTYYDDKGCLIAMITRVRNNSKGVIRKYYSRDEVDYFGVYSPELDKVYLIHFDDKKAKGALQLRVKPAKNNNAKNVMHAEKFEI